ncbi:hypothetical protein NP233_g5696 [Leucocoprinus birnbaumii]|uniref:Aminoglycoside phosphotransferase domain-containing protein n=1 Tax=Leucocoprinus birnbaumii TaxID=56174 RepID=A0AAD5VSQ2_9AGAR|nr:hypothetical protein NP233_g5696 [Leucocoprinus birnbaumii]
MTVLPSRIIFGALWRLWLLAPNQWRLRVYRKLKGWDRYSEKLGWSTWRLPFGLVLKFTRRQHPQIEVSNIHFVRDHTSIPVPTVRDSIFDSAEGTGLIVMDWIDGETLCKWLDRHTETPLEVTDCINALLNPSSHDKIDHAAIMEKYHQYAHFKTDLSTAGLLLDDMRNALLELRSVQSESSAICGLGGRPLPSARCSDQRHTLPPSQDVNSFHEKLLAMALRGPCESRRPRIMQLAEPVFRKHHRVCFTHTDLNSLNIMVRNGRLVGIIDWEYAGWYPEYWEYTALSYVVDNNQPELTFWGAVGIFSGKYEQELALEKALWACTGVDVVYPGTRPEFYLDQP